MFLLTPPFSKLFRDTGNYSINMSNPEEILNVEGEKSITPATTTTADYVESKRESLSILACLGSTKEYLGTEMELKDTYKLSEKDVEKFYKRYQVVSGKKIADGLADSSFQLISQVVSNFINIDDPKSLANDWKNDQLILKEASELYGLLVLRGGRLVALLLALIHLAKHFKLSEPEKEMSTTPTPTEQ